MPALPVTSPISIFLCKSSAPLKSVLFVTNGFMRPLANKSKLSLSSCLVQYREPISSRSLTSMSAEFARNCSPLPPSVTYLPPLPKIEQPNSRDDLLETKSITTSKSLPSV